MQHALLIALVAASYVLFAGAPTWTLGPLLGVAALGVLAAPRRTLGFPKECRGLDLALIALFVAVGLQLVPLPLPVAGLLSPHAAEVRESLQFAALAPSAPSWQALSINPSATGYALGTVALGILSFWIARATFSAGGHTRRVCRTLALLAATAAVVALVQRIVTPRLVLGMLDPGSPNASPFGAFLNRNDFAAWLLMASMVSGGYLIAHMRIHPAYDRGWRAAVRQFLGSGALMTAGSLVVTLGVIVTTLSRSAAAGLGMACLTAWGLGRQRMRVERTNLPTLFGLAGMVVLVAVLFVDLEGWATRVEHTIADSGGVLGRANIWRETLPVVWDFKWSGTGAGTFSDAMLRYQQTRVWVGAMQQWAHFNNAHSHYLQVAAEGGLLVSIPAACCLFFLTAHGRRTIRGDKGEMFWVRVGAAAGLAGVAVQSLWEVALILPANAVMCGVLAALVLYQRDPDADRTLERYERPPAAPVRMA